MKGKDFLSIRDFSPSEIFYLLILARQVKAHPGTYNEALKRETLAMIFEKPSLRTRVSFDVGIQQLGGFSIYLAPTRSIWGNASRSMTLPRISNAWCRAS